MQAITKVLASKTLLKKHKEEIRELSKVLSRALFTFDGTFLLAPVNLTFFAFSGKMFFTYRTSAPKWARGPPRMGSRTPSLLSSIRAFPIPPPLTRARKVGDIETQARC